MAHAPVEDIELRQVCDSLSNPFSRNSQHVRKSTHVLELRRCLGQE